MMHNAHGCAYFLQTNEQRPRRYDRVHDSLDIFLCQITNHRNVRKRAFATSEELSAAMVTVAVAAVMVHKSFVSSDVVDSGRYAHH